MINSAGKHVIHPFDRAVPPTEPPRLLVFVGNPTQYHSPIFRKLSDALGGRMEVMYGDDIGARPFFNAEVNAVIDWDIPVLGGFPYRIFPNRAQSDRKGFWSRNNPSMIWHVYRSPATHILLHGYDTLSSWYVYFAALLSGKKIIWRGETVAKIGQRPGRMEIVKRTVLPIYFRLCNKILYSCSNNRDYLSTFTPNSEQKFVPFPCAVDNDFFRKNAVADIGEQQSLRNELNIPEGHVVIATCSRLTKRKRTDAILDAIARLPERRATLLVIGDGPERPALVKRAKELGVSLVIAGFVGQLKVARLLSISDIFILLSIYDPSPKALNEAMSFPIPIVASTGVGTARDLVQHGVNGYLFEAGQEEALTGWLKQWIDNPEKRRAMGQANAAIIAGYSIDIDVRNVMGILGR